MVFFGTNGRFTHLFVQQQGNDSVTLEIHAGDDINVGHWCGQKSPFLGPKLAQNSNLLSKQL